MWKTIIVGIGCFAMVQTGYAKEEAVFLETRPTVIQPVMLSYEEETTPNAVVILFAGSTGQVKIREGQLPANGNFLVRSRQLFVQQHIAAVVVDSPSDQEDGMNDAFRMSSAHVEDIRHIIAEVGRRFSHAPVYLIGTSRGTISAAYAAKALPSEVAGVVLTSTVFHAQKLPPEGLKIPLLFVHNTDDGCRESPFTEAVKASQETGYPLIRVHGGSIATGKGACGPYSPHGYLNKESATVKAICDWIYKKPYSADL